MGVGPDYTVCRIHSVRHAARGCSLPVTVAEAVNRVLANCFPEERECIAALAEDDLLKLDFGLRQHHRKGVSRNEMPQREPGSNWLSPKTDREDAPPGFERSGF